MINVAFVALRWLPPPRVGPLLGALAAILVCSRLARRIEVAKLYHFENDRRRLFHRMAGSQ